MLFCFFLSFKGKSCRVVTVVRWTVLFFLIIKKGKKNGERSTRAAAASRAAAAATGPAPPSAGRRRVAAAAAAAPVSGPEAVVRGQPCAFTEGTKTKFLYFENSLKKKQEE